MASIRLAGGNFDSHRAATTNQTSFIDALKPAATAAQRTAVRIGATVPFYIEHVVAALDDIANDEQVPEALYARCSPDCTPARTCCWLCRPAVIGPSGDVGLSRTVVEGVQRGADVQRCR